MQHFLLSSAARSLSLKAVFRMGEAVAYQTFCQMRWPETEGEAVCPRCGCTETYGIVILIGWLAGGVGRCCIRCD